MSLPCIFQRYIGKEEISLKKSLKFVKEIFEANHVTFPNKEQLIIAWLCERLAEQIRLDSRENFQLSWQTFHDILKGPRFQKMISNSVWIPVKSSFAEVIIETLRCKKSSLALPEIIECCSIIIEVPSLASIFTRKYETFVELIVVILELMASSTTDSEILPNFLNKLLEMCLTLQKQQINQVQVYKTTLSTLFIPACNYLCLTSSNKDFWTLKGLLRSVIKNALFHRDLMPAYRQWLDTINEPSSDTLHCGIVKLSKFIDDHLSDDNNEYDSSTFTKKFSLESKGVAFNILLRGFSEKKRDITDDYNYKMMIMLCKKINIGCSDHGILQFPAADVTQIQPLEYKVQLIALKEMLQVVALKRKVFISQEDSKTNVSLQFFAFLAFLLLDFCSIRDASWFQCFNCFLQINVIVLEANIKKVLRRSFLEQPKLFSDVQAAQDQFLLNLLRKFNQLRRLPFLIENLILESKFHNKEDIILSPIVLKRFGEFFQELPHGQMLELWKTVIEHFTAMLQPINLSSLDIILIQILQIILLNPRVIDHTVLKDVVVKSVKLFLETRDNCLVPVMKALQENDVKSLSDKEKLKLSYGLGLCSAWGHLQQVLCQFELAADISLGSIHKSALDLSYCHSYLSRKEWKQIHKSLSVTDNKQIQFQQWMLMLQKVYALKQADIDSVMMKEKVNVALQSQASKLSELAFQDIEKQLSKSETVESLEICIWKEFLQEIPLLFEHLPLSCKMTCCMYIVKVGLNEELRFMSDEMKKIMSNDKHHQVKEFQICLVNAIFQTVQEIIEGPGSSEEKSLFRLLHEEIIVWLTYSHTTPKSKDGFCLWNIFSEAAEIMNNVFEQGLNCEARVRNEIDFSKIAQLLKIFEWLPLQYLLPGTQTCCLFGMLGIMNALRTAEHHLESKRLIDIAQNIIITILKGNRSIWLFHYIHSGHFLSWLLDFHISTMRQLKNTEVKEFEDNFHKFFEKILLLIARNYISLPHLKGFISKICQFHYTPSDLGICTSYVKVASELLNTLIQIPCNPKSVPVDSKNLCYEYINQLVLFIISLINTSSFLKLDDQSTVAAFLNAFCRIITAESKLAGSIQKLKHKKLMTDVFQYTADILDHHPFSELGEASLEVALMAFIHHKKCRKRFPAAFVTKIWLSIISVYFKGNTKTAIKAKTDENFNDSEREILKEDQQSNIQSRWFLMEKKIIDLVSALCSTVETSEFIWMLKELLNLREELSTTNTLNSKSVALMKLWNSVILVNYSQERIKDLSPIAQQFLMYLQAILGEIGAVPCLIEDFTIPALEIIKNLLKHGKILLGQHYVGLCLHGCLSIPLLDIYPVSVDLFCRATIAIHSVLNEMLLHHKSVVIKSLPIYISAVTNLLQAVMQGSDQTKVLLSTFVSYQLKSCAQYIERLLNLLATLKDDVMRIAPYIISTFVGQLETITIHKDIKAILERGINRLLSLCDEHSIRLLRTNLSPSSQEIFNDLYSIFTKYHKFIGKV